MKVLTPKRGINALGALIEEKLIENEETESRQCANEGARQQQHKAARHANSSRIFLSKKLGLPKIKST